LELVKKQGKKENYSIVISVLNFAIKKGYIKNDSKTHDNAVRIHEAKNRGNFKSQKQ